MEEIGDRVFYGWWNGSSLCRLAYCNPSDCDGTTQVVTYSGSADWMGKFVVDQGTGRIFWYDNTAMSFMVAASTGVPAPTPLTSRSIRQVRRLSLPPGGGILFNEDTDAGSALNRVPVSGGIVSTLISDSTALLSFAASSTRVFWADHGKVRYLALPNGNSGPQDVILANPDRMWSEGEELFFVEAGGALRHCTVSNCATSVSDVFVPSNCSITALTGDATQVYWTQDCGSPVIEKSQIWKLAR